jgi:hypothetical protein
MSPAALNSGANGDYDTIDTAMGADATLPVPPFHNQNPSQKAVGRTPPLALHWWVLIDTRSDATVTWDEPLILQMGLIKTQLHTYLIDACRYKRYW